MSGGVEGLLESMDPRVMMALNVVIWGYVGLQIWAFHRAFLRSGRRRLTRLEPVGWGILLPLAVFGFFFFFSLCGVLIPADDVEHSPLPFLLFGNLLQILAGLFGWWMAFSLTREPVGALLGLRPRGIPAGIMWAAIGLFFMMGPFLMAAGVSQGFFELVHWRVEEQELVELFRESIGTSLWPVLLVTAGVVAPVMEEIMFRGFLYRALVNWTGYRWFPIVVSGLVFSLFHFHALSVLPLWVIGIFLAAVYERTGNLWSAIFLHAGFNTAQVLIMMYQ